jgi:hypothetical protein
LVSPSEGSLSRMRREGGVGSPSEGLSPGGLRMSGEGREGREEVPAHVTQLGTLPRGRFSGGGLSPGRDW